MLSSVILRVDLIKAPLEEVHGRGLNSWQAPELASYGILRQSPRPAQRKPWLEGDCSCQSSWLMLSQILPMKFWSLQEPWRQKMRFDTQTSDPEHKRATCPRCYSRRTYFDGRMGHYCLFCGHQFSSEGVQVLPGHEFRQISATPSCLGVDS